MLLLELLVTLAPMLAAAAAQPAAAAAAPPAVPPAVPTVRQGGLVDVELLCLGTEGDDPWRDPAVGTVAIVGPAGGSVSVLEAFVAVNYTRSLRSAAAGERISEHLAAVSAPQLRFRYRPSFTGRHEWSANITWRSQPSTLHGSFVVRPAVGPLASVIGVSQNGRYFCEGKDDAAYYPVGGNIECWDCVLGERQEKPRGNYGGSRAPANGTYEFDYWFGRLAAVGGNFARVWTNAPSGLWTELAPNITVSGEHGPHTIPGGGLGHYDMASAWRLDHVLTEARRRGIRVLLSIEMSRTQDSSREWDWSPYNREQGGMLDNASRFFTDPQAMRVFQARLRYLVARFGHHTSIFAFELFNEVNCDNEIPGPQLLADWHATMADTILQADRYGHMVTTSFCGDPMSKPQTVRGLSFSWFALNDAAAVDKQQAQYRVVLYPDELQRAVVRKPIGPFCI
jgi:hypothetical protein